MANYLAPLLRGVIFVRDPSHGLRAVRNDNEIVMGSFGALQPDGPPEVLEAIILERRSIAIRVIYLVRVAARPWVEQVEAVFGGA